MLNYMKSYWDVGASVGGCFAAITASKISPWIELLIAVATFCFVVCRLFVWVLKARMTWKNRNNTHFFEKTKEEVE